MSAKVMGAVMDCGPSRLRLRLALVAIADNADDFGFASLNMETIAAKALCERRHAMRIVAQLEREKWISVRRRAVGGKGSVYFIDIARLGVIPDKKSRKSEWHIEFERGAKMRFSGDNSSPDAIPPAKPVAKSMEDNGSGTGAADKEDSSDKMSPENECGNADFFFAPGDSGDNSQGVQVTFSQDSGDISSIPILKNRLNHLNPGNTPLPPSQARGGASCGSRPLRGESVTCDEAVAKVMRECGITDRRTGGTIAAAIALYRAKTDEPPNCNAVAEAMIAARGEYLNLANRGLLAYQVGPRKFFGLGMWADPRTWELDKRELQEERMRAIARIGS